MEPPHGREIMSHLPGRCDVVECTHCGGPRPAPTKAPRLTAALAQAALDLIADGDVRDYTDDENLAYDAIRALKDGHTVTIDADVLREARAYLESMVCRSELCAETRCLSVRTLVARIDADLKEIDEPTPGREP